MFSLLPVTFAGRAFTRVLGALIVALLVACGSSRDSSELVGRYDAQFEFGQERLELRADGSYTQTLKLVSVPAPVPHSGRWEFDADRDLVIVHTPLLFEDGFGKLNPAYATPSDGSWNLDVRTSWGSITLAWNDDAGVQLKMVK